MGREGDAGTDSSTRGQTDKVTREKDVPSSPRQAHPTGGTSEAGEWGGGFPGTGAARSLPQRQRLLRTWRARHGGCSAAFPGGDAARSHREPRIETLGHDGPKPTRDCVSPEVMGWGGTTGCGRSRLERDEGFGGSRTAIFFPGEVWGGVSYHRDLVTWLAAAGR